MKLINVMPALLIIAVLVAACKKSEKEPQQTPVQEETAISQNPATPTAAAKKQHDTLATPAALPEKQLVKNPGDYTVAFAADVRYTLQLSSWKTRKYAEQDRLRFFDAGFDCRIDEVVLPETGKKWYRVRLGSFKTRKAATDFADKYINELLEEPAWIDYK